MKIPLPPGKEQTKLGIQTGVSHVDSPSENAAPLAFLPEEERQVVLNVAAQILLPQEHARMRPEIVAHRKRIAEWNKRKRQQARICPRYFRRAAAADLPVDRCAGQSDGTVGVAFNGGS